MLDMRGCILHQALSMSQISSQCRYILSGVKATTQQSVLMQLLKPLGVIDIGLSPRHLLNLASIDQQYFQATGLENFKQGYPVETGSYNQKVWK